MVSLIANSDGRRRGPAIAVAVRCGLGLLLLYGMAPNAAAQGGPPGTQPQAAADAPEAPSSLEPAVAEHIQSLEASTAALVREKASADRVAAAYGLLGQAYHAYSLAPSAEASYLEAHRLAPNDFRWPYLLGYLFQQQNKADDALAYYAVAKTLRAEYAPLSVNVGNLQLRQNRIDEAQAAFEVALAIDPSIAAARYGLGQVALSRRDYAGAVEHFSSVLTKVPDANRVHYALALAFRGLGQIEQAQAHLALQGAVGVRASDPIVDGLADLVRGARLSVLNGRLAFEAGRYAEAAEAFRKAVAAEPDSIPARVNLGSALGRLKEVDGALGQFREALELDPSNRAALYNLAVLYGSQGRHARAVLHLTRLLELAPDDDEVRLVLGQELSLAGRPVDALAALAKVAGDDPGNEAAVLAQATVLSSLGRHREALEVIERSHTLFPTKGLTAARLAYWLAASPQQDLRDPARALELSRQVYRATGAVGHGAVIAMALAGLGRCEEAVQWQREMIEKAEQSDPGLVVTLTADLQRYQASCG